MILKNISVGYYRNNFLKRSFVLSVNDDSIKFSQKMSNYSYNATIETLQDFTKLFSKEITLIEDWGDERFLVTSNIETSKVIDIIYNEDLGEYPTFQLYNLLNDWKKFQDEFQDKARFRIIIVTAFKEICKNPNKFKKWENGDLFEIFIEDILVNLVLIKEDGDFNLSTNEYINQIKELN